MELEEIDYKFLLTKYKKSGLTGIQLEKRLQLIDPYISLNLLSLTISYIYL